ncbi:MAG: ClpXP protease specificity-enhancing factor [Methylococcaceae bacterium]|nr:ClpXP protease specificity-enhancing factor [Methylococcaceae bacterium]MDZ4155998.1 ClpXP protease specificity-enhancing factor [Methylococcales bacterium]MDP2395183.1 ClpXP protease specificity-enhancing factor [Methylococcaceae bacterium]MDP3018675.1 ClpXP protease specificity-enhancing factor [Methylococcaceae bacterium]MDP3388869.1 ClpXP protease specificity-enhancing factor [Methylococcaceae bacterium]
MTSLKPYLIRSIYEWIVDNDLTPHLLVDAENTDAVLPQEFIEDGKIVLNIKPQAIQGLSLGNDFIEFNARFSGKPLHIVTPVTAVLAIYARENGKGMVFDREDDDNEPPPEKKPVASKPHLRVVK